MFGGVIQENYMVPQRTQPPAQERSKPATFYQRVASGGDATIAKCLELCQEVGYPQPTSREELRDALTAMVAQKGQPILIEVIKAHPDFELIKAVVDAEQESKPTGQAAMLNDTGNHYHCNACGSAHPFRNDSGATIMPAVGTSAASSMSLPTDMNGMMLGLLMITGFLGAIGFLIILVSKALNPSK